MKIAEEGGIKVIVATMQGHAENAVVQEKTCGALWNLSDNTDNKVKIAEES